MSFNNQPGKICQIHDMYDPTKYLDIYSISYYDLWVNTVKVDHARDIYEEGRNFRIYSGSRSGLFHNLHKTFIDLLGHEMDLNKIDLLQKQPITACAKEAKLEDPEGDDSVFRVRKDKFGHIIVQTHSYKFPDDIKGPEIYLCGRVSKDSSEILQERSRICSPLFRLTTKVASTFNQHSLK